MPPTEVLGGSALTPGAAVERTYLMVFTESSSRAVPLPRHGEVLVGRAPEAEVMLEDTAVSRQHAILTLDDGRASIRDLGSQNGTHVDGVRVAGEAKVRNGAVIRVCSTQMVFHAAGLAQRDRAVDLDRLRAALDDEIERADLLERALVGQLSHSDSWYPCRRIRLWFIA